MNPISYFFQEDALSAQKIRLSITFSQQSQMDWIKALPIEKKCNLLEKKFKKKNSNFCKSFFAGPSPLFWVYLGITLFWWSSLKYNFMPKNYIPMKFIIFSIFKKCFKKS